MNTNIDIYWFSGTGNTLYVANKAAEYLERNGKKVSLFPMEKMNPKEINLNHTIGIVVPVAAQGTFPNVWKFVDSLPITNNTGCFFIDTLRIYSGGIKGPIKKIIKDKGYFPIGAIEIKMPNTFGKRKENTIKEELILNNANKKIEKYISNILNSKASWRDIPIYSELMSRFYRTRKATSKWVKLYRKNITNKCIECGICKNICPEKCYKDDEKFIDVNSDKCILCQRCLEYCPENAIQINGKDFIKNNRIKYSEFQKYLQQQ